MCQMRLGRRHLQKHLRRRFGCLTTLLFFFFFFFDFLDCTSFCICGMRHGSFDIGILNTKYSNPFPSHRGAYLYSSMKRLFISIIMATVTIYYGLSSIILDFPKKIVLPLPEVSSLSLLHIRKQIKCLLM